MTATDIIWPAVVLVLGIALILVTAPAVERVAIARDLARAGTAVQRRRAERALKRAEAAEDEAQGLRVRVAAHADHHKACQMRTGRNVFTGALPLSGLQVMVEAYDGIPDQVALRRSESDTWGVPARLNVPS